jgi:ABC-type glutathione transport system ATPase component
MLETEDVARHFDVSRPLLQRLVAREGKRSLRAVDGISFSIPKGTTLSLVGESGCGKSTVARLVGRAVSPDARAGDLRRPGSGAGTRRQRAAPPHADDLPGPYASLNPRWRVRDIIAEPIRAFGLLKGQTAADRRAGGQAADPGRACRRSTAEESRMNSRAGSGSASRSPARCPPTRNSWSATSRPRRSTSACRRRS